MKRHRLLVAAAIMGLSAPFLATSISSPAMAQYGNESDRGNEPYRGPDRGDDTYRGPDHRRDDHGYPQYPRLQSMRRVAFLARAVEASAVRLERETFARQGRLNWQQRRTLGQIQALSNAASHFRAQVQSFQRDPSHTQADFEQLVRAYYVTGRSLDDINAGGAARRDYEALRGRMNELMRSYGGASRWTRYNTPGPYGR